MRYLTFSCRDKQALLAAPVVRDLFMEELGRCVKWKRLLVHAFVVMPDHVHLLATAACGVPISITLRDLKRRTAILINARLSRSGPVWEPGGGHDRPILTRKEYLQKLNYIHANPERAGLLEWRHSSAGAYRGEAYDGPEITFLETDFRW